MVDFTIAIPTYNGEHRLPEVLDALQSQVGIDHLVWEILVVDNNSKDQTAEVVRRYQENSPVPIHYVLEIRQGAAYARDRAVQVAHSDLIGFLDDDNIPSPEWIAAAFAFAQSHPNIGAIASRIYADYEIAPPENFKRISAFLAITQRGDTPLLYRPDQRILPPSAGLVVHRQTWLECVPAKLILVGRIEGTMLTGEDTEMLSYIQQSGREIWYNPAMTLRHKIPKHRLQRDYLLPFFRGIGLSRHVTRMLNVRPAQRPMMVVAHFVNDLRKILVHLIRYRFQIRTDVVAACEMQLFLSSLVSPFYLWRKGYLTSESLNYRHSRMEATQG